MNLQNYIQRGFKIDENPAADGLRPDQRAVREKLQKLIDDAELRSRLAAEEAAGRKERPNSFVNLVRPGGQP